MFIFRGTVFLCKRVLHTMYYYRPNTIPLKMLRKETFDPIQKSLFCYPLQFLFIFTSIKISFMTSPYNTSANFHKRHCLWPILPPYIFLADPHTFFGKCVIPIQIHPPQFLEEDYYFLTLYIMYNIKIQIDNVFYTHTLRVFCYA